MEQMLGTAFRDKKQSLQELYEYNIDKVDAELKVPKHLLHFIGEQSEVDNSVVVAYGGARVTPSVTKEVTPISNAEQRLLLQEAATVQQKIISRTYRQSVGDPAVRGEAMTVASSFITLPTFLETTTTVEGRTVKTRRPIVLDYLSGSEEDKKKNRAVYAFFNMRLAENRDIAAMVLNLKSNTLNSLRSKIGVLVHEDVITNILLDKADPYQGVTAEALLVPRDIVGAIRSKKWKLVLLAGNTTYWAQYNITENMTEKE